MTSENPFENGSVVVDADVVADSDPAAKTPANARSKVSGNGSTQLQPPPVESAVDDDLAGEKSPDNADGPLEDLVDAELVDETEDDETKPSDAEVADKVELWKPPPFPSIEADWKYETLEYQGFNLGIRIPNSQALTAFTMSTGAYVPDLLKQNMVSMFVHRHFSPQSYAFLMTRLMDPEAEDFNEETFSDIVRLLVERAGEKLIAEAEAKAALEKKQTKRGKR